MKRIYRSTKDKMIAGVCGGLAEYFNVDPAIVRIIATLLIAAWGSGLLVYIACAFIMPADTEVL